MSRVRDAAGQHAASFTQAKKFDLKWADLELRTDSFDERAVTRRRGHYRPGPVAQSTEYASIGMDDSVDESTGIDWDDVVDVVCIGRGAGALAAAIGADRSGMSVLFADAGRAAKAGGAEADSLAGRLGVADAETVTYLDALTEDIGPLIRCAVPSQVPMRAVDGPQQSGPARRGGIATFVGSALRGWADRCLASPYGLLFTSPAHSALTDTYTSAGESLEAVVVGTIDVADGRLTEELGQWLASRADALGLADASSNALQRIVFDDGRVVGAIIDTPEGACAVRAKRGVVMATGGSALTPTLPTGGLQDVSSVSVALVTRAASRFARLELLAAPIAR